MDPGEEPPTKVSFFQASLGVCTQGALLIGWSLPHQDKEILANQDKGEFQRTIHQIITSEDAGSEEPSIREWVINPPNKMLDRSWCNDSDKLVVLTLKDDAPWEGPEEEDTIDS